MGRNKFYRLRFPVPGGGCGSGYCELVVIAPTVDAMENDKASSSTILLNMMISFRSRVE
jgi:hypothetical protein